MITVNDQSMPLVSIAMATYNGAAYLEEQMSSLLAQTYPETEIVVSDDGSTDGTWALLEKFAEADERVRIYQNQGESGFNGNFIHCFSKCRGEYISPCDQDDYWEPEKTTRLIAALDRAEFAYCDSEFVNAEGRSENIRFSGTRYMFEGSDPRPLIHMNTISGHAMLFPSRCLEQIGQVPKGMFYDWWIAFVLVASGSRVAYVDEPLVRYRRHQQAVTKAEPTDKLRATKRKRMEWHLRLEAFASYPSKHQAYFIDMATAWLGWYRSWNGWAFFRRVWVDRSLIFSLSRRSPASSALKYLLGYQLRHRLQPSSYPLLEMSNTQSGS